MTVDRTRTWPTGGAVASVFRRADGRVIARLLRDGRLQTRCVLCGVWWIDRHPGCWALA